MRSRIILAVLIVLSVLAPVMAADSTDSLNSAGALYSQSVDLANEGKYPQALAAADKALAMNVTALTALIQSNRAGILVMMNRNDEAVAAADAALAVEGNLTTVHSIAYYNKGNALRALGRMAEAKEAYDRAYALDNTLVPPNLGPILTTTTATTVPAATVLPTPARNTAEPVPSPTRSPLSPAAAIGALCLAGLVLAAARNR